MIERPTKHSVTLRGHRTSVSLEPSFWEALKALAQTEGRSLDALVAEIDAERAAADPTVSLASVLRVRLLSEARRGRI
ncbi:MAG: ribbon-helix-helix domain-containing protein [Neomegalonema sp.]|nr:ribbon-helix-helix domain-containing protein [Neomegalonema sp.]